jgi:hypothetical protein
MSGLARTQRNALQTRNRPITRSNMWAYIAHNMDHVTSPFDRHSCNLRRRLTA